MELIGQETCPLPDHPVLAEMAKALNDEGHWSEIIDREWRAIYMTDEARRMYGGRVELSPYPVGVYLWGREYVSTAMEWRGGQFPLEIHRRGLAAYGPWMLADTPGGKEELRARVDPRLADIVDGLSPVELATAASFKFRGIFTAAGAGVDISSTLVRLRDDAGAIVGTAFISKPAVGMAVLTRISARGDLGHFERMDQVAKPGRRPAAILFADLESSSQLARGLSTERFFKLIRRLAYAADQSVVDAGGIVGSHAGDGVVAFFLAETAGSESAAAHNCITATRALRAAVSDVAARSELQADDVVLRFGLHWGANLYVGQITTSGRAEVTALGDQVNEAARIEACATGGRALASKDLMERLEREAAAALDIDPGRVSYTSLADLATATEKARRDAPAIAVCEI